MTLLAAMRTKMKTSWMTQWPSLNAMIVSKLTSNTSLKTIPRPNREADKLQVQPLTRSKRRANEALRQLTEAAGTSVEEGEVAATEMKTRHVTVAKVLRIVAEEQAQETTITITLTTTNSSIRIVSGVVAVEATLDRMVTKAEAVGAGEAAAVPRTISRKGVRVGEEPVDSVEAAAATETTIRERSWIETMPTLQRIHSRQLMMMTRTNKIISGHQRQHLAIIATRTTQGVAEAAVRKGVVVEEAAEVAREAVAVAVGAVVAVMPAIATHTTNAI